MIILAKPDKSFDFRFVTVGKFFFDHHHLFFDEVFDERDNFFVFNNPRNFTDGKCFLDINGFSNQIFLFVELRGIAIKIRILDNPGFAG